MWHSASPDASCASTRPLCRLLHRGVHFEPTNSTLQDEKQQPTHEECWKQGLQKHGFSSGVLEARMLCAPDLLQQLSIYTIMAGRSPMWDKRDDQRIGNIALQGRQLINRLPIACSNGRILASAMEQSAVHCDSCPCRDTHSTDFGQVFTLGFHDHGSNRRAAAL